MLFTWTIQWACFAIERMVPTTWEYRRTWNENCELRNGGKVLFIIISTSFSQNIHRFSFARIYRFICFNAALHRSAECVVVIVVKSYCFCLPFYCKYAFSLVLVFPLNECGDVGGILQILSVALENIWRINLYSSGICISKL